MNRAIHSRHYLVAVALLAGLVAYWCFRNVGSQHSKTQVNQTEGENQTLATGYSPWTLPTEPSSSQGRQIGDADTDDESWDSETLHSLISQQLRRISNHMEVFPGERDDDDIRDVQAENFQCQPLRPPRLRIPFDGDLFRVRRSATPSMDTSKHVDLPDALHALMSADSGPVQNQSPREVQVYFKVTHIQRDGAEIVSRVLVEISRATRDGFATLNATWRCKWQQLAEHDLRLASIEVVDYEDAIVKSPQPLFEDVTSAVLDTNRSHGEHLLRGIDHWCHRLTHIDDMRMHGHHGFAIADVNGDRLEDLYVCDAGGLPNRLYLQQADGTALDFSRESNADWLESSAAALLIDLDNDGDQDLAVTTVAGLLFASNDGAGHFSPRAVQPGLREAHSISAADYDNDGDLDLYVCIYGDSSSTGGQVGYEATPPIPYSDANNGGTNILFRNDGSFRFVDVTNQCGLDRNNHRWSFAAAWEDYDLDGDMDLYVANDFGRNNLYQNIGGSFRDVAAELGVEDRAGGMSVAWADFNVDGQRDLYIGNMFSAAGNRITYQRRFLNNRSAANAQDIQRMARGNTLFMADRSGRFADVSLDAGVTMGRWSWGCKPLDMNNDGFEDLVVANGFFTNQKPDDL